MTEKPSHHEKRSSLHVDQHKTKFSQGGFSAESKSCLTPGPDPSISEICGFASVASGGAAVGNVRSVPDRAALLLRASPSVGSPGQRVSACQIVWNRANRRAGARGGARAGRPRCVRILTITAGSSMAAMIFKLPPQFGQCSMSMSKTRLSKRAQLMRADAPCACARRRARWCSAGAGHDRGTQPRIGCQHAVEADQMQARTRHQGGQALHEFQRRHDDVRGAVAPGALQLQHDITGAIALEPFVGDRRAAGTRPSEAYRHRPQ